MRASLKADGIIAKSLRDGQRVVYTSPIKALSNQKFRDLQVRVRGEQDNQCDKKFRDLRVQPAGVGAGWECIKVGVKWR